MNKFLSTLVCGLLLSVTVSTAQASVISDWSYELKSAELNLNGDIGYIYDSWFVDDKGMTFNSGGYANSIESKNPSTGNLFLADSPVSLTQSNSDVLLRYDTSVNNFETARNGEKITDLSFTYAIASASAGISMNIKYSMSLYTYYDAALKTSYVYYNTNELSAQGRNFISHDGYTYGVAGVGFFVDGMGFSEFTAEDGTIYSGWAINEETRYNTYDNYVVGGENSAIDPKTWTGSFDITASFSMLAYSSVFPTSEAALRAVAPSPTPEPATMLLTGLGLAGLGAIKRRRNRAA